MHWRGSLWCVCSSRDYDSHDLTWEKVFFVIGSALLLVATGAGSFGHRWMNLPSATIRLGLKVNFMNNLMKNFLTFVDFP